MFAALDLATGQMFYRFRDRKRWPQFLALSEQVRHLPTGTPYLVCDDYQPHAKAEVTDWCATHGIELVYTPAGHLRWRNRHCHPRRHFAVDSKISRPDYLPNVT